MSEFPTWQPMESAPRVIETDILVWDGSKMWLAWFDRKQCCWRDSTTADQLYSSGKLTHWMPLPEPPSTVK